MTSVSSATTSNLAQYASSISSLDTNGDGIVSAEEQAAGSARTQDPTVTTDSAATSSASQLSADMMAMVLAKGDQSSSDASSTESSREAARFNAMDSDKDGKVSEAEFVAARPKEISEEDATKRFESLDTAQTGSLTAEQLASDRPKGGPMGGMNMESLSKILSEDSDSDTMSMDDLFSKMSSVIAAYRSAGGTADETGSSATSTTAAPGSVTV